MLLFPDLIVRSRLFFFFLNKLYYQRHYAAISFKKNNKNAFKKKQKKLYKNTKCYLGILQNSVLLFLYMKAAGNL